MGMIDLKCGDCLELIKEIPDNSIDLIVTDPPYCVNYKTNWRKDKNHRFCKPIINDDNESVIILFLNEAYRVLKNNTAIYIFCNSNKVDFFKQEIEKSGI